MGRRHWPRPRAERRGTGEQDDRARLRGDLVRERAQVDPLVGSPSDKDDRALSIRRESGKDRGWSRRRRVVDEVHPTDGRDVL